jgi:hypothetical protein
MLLFSELSKPVARLHFGGGYIRRAIADETEGRRKRRGLSQNKLASPAGRSQVSMQMPLGATIRLGAGGQPATGRAANGARPPR